MGHDYEGNLFREVVQPDPDQIPAQRVERGTMVNKVDH